MAGRRIFKVIIIGDGNVGKTSIRRRYFGEGFTKNYLVTLGADFALKRLENDVMQIWDLAGQSVYKPLRKNYYMGAHCGLLVFDLTEQESFDNLDKWVDEIETFVGRFIPLILVGNKVDLIEEGYSGVDPERIQDYKEELEQRCGFDIPYITTSALSGVNIEEAFQITLNQIKS